MSVIIVARFLHFASMMSLFGAFLFPLYAGKHTVLPAHAALAIRYARWVALMAFVSALLWLACIIASVTDNASSVLKPGLIIQVLLETNFGPIWLAHLAAVIALLTLAWLTSAANLNGRLVLFAGLNGLGLFTLAGIGHAAASEGPTLVLRVGIQGAHLITGGLWFGALPPLGLLLRYGRKTGDFAALSNALKNFASAGYAAVATILATGLANTYFTTGSMLPDSSSDYGRILIAKITLFWAGVGLAFVNRFVLVPRLEEDRSVAKLSRNIALEIVAIALVIACVSVLGVTPPVSQ